ncbi:MAG: hypothetical protein H6621_07195 [Halobacteriovoraceae bacterium]|nr:hypothetical protein [Halobacteriovoraceae bacterium]
MVFFLFFSILFLIFLANFFFARLWLIYFLEAKNFDYPQEVHKGLKAEQLLGRFQKPLFFYLYSSEEFHPLFIINSGNSCSVFMRKDIFENISGREFTFLKEIVFCEKSKWKLRFLAILFIFEKEVAAIFKPFVNIIEKFFYFKLFAQWILYPLYYVWEKMRLALITRTLQRWDEFEEDKFLIQRFFQKLKWSGRRSYWLSVLQNQTTRA